MTASATRPLVCVVDDDSLIRESVESLLRQAGFRVETFDSAEHFLGGPHRPPPACVIVDLALPGMSGLDLHQELARTGMDAPIMLLTAHGDIRTSVRAMKEGAFDFLTKPFDADDLLAAVRRAVSRRFPATALRADGTREIVGESEVLQAVLRQIELVADTDATVLITGETGTGKEMVARAIHQTSPRHRGRFVAINVSAIPETLLDAELFGHARGAFTGAVAMRQGRLEQADGGTLFLDEVGTMPMPLQMKMLRVLQEREFERLGDTRTIKVDVRIVAATNADLSKMVKEGTFREDLYYRLNVIPVHIAPLRERIEDIPLLVQTFVKKFAPDRDVTVAQDAMRRLMAYAWPGNVRQLENAIERAIAMSGSRTQIDVGDLPADLQATGEAMTKPLVELPVSGVDLPALIAQIEKDMIGRALTRTEQNKGAAARLLGLKRTTLVEKLKRL